MELYRAGRSGNAAQVVHVAADDQWPVVKMACGRSLSMPNPAVDATQPTCPKCIASDEGDRTIEQRQSCAAHRARGYQTWCASCRAKAVVR